VTTSFKTAVDVTQGHLIPWIDYTPDWRGWRSLGLSPDTLSRASTVRTEFLRRFGNSVLTSVGASLLAVGLGSLAAYGLSRFRYKFLWMRNNDISFFFLSQLILPPVVLALPFLVLYRELALLDTTIGLIFLYTLTVLPIVIWIMRDQFDTIPTELDEAALVDGPVFVGRLRADHHAHCPARHGRRIHPVAHPVLERVFLRRLAHQHQCKDAAGDGRQPDRIAGHQLVVDGGPFDAAIAPLVVIGIALERYIIKGLTAGAVK
jgi:multiple sugar transport system permease protein